MSADGTARRVARPCYRSAMLPGARRILGIDPGTRVAGWGVIETRGNTTRLVAHGAIRTRGPEMPQRLHEVGEGLRTALATHEPDVVVVETPYVGKNAKSALVVGMARGIALLVAAESDVEVHEYPPATIKRAVVGNGNASKEQVGEMVRVLLGLAEPPRPADAADALAIAIAHAHRSRFTSALPTGARVRRTRGRGG